MTPEPDKEYYNGIDEQLFNCNVLNPRLHMSKFDMVKAGTLIVRTVHTEYMTTVD